VRHVLGIDGGNSKTLAVVGDDTGRVLGVGRAGSGSHQAIGLAGALENIRMAAETALQTGEVRVSQVDMVYYALAGADLPEDFELLRPALRELQLAQAIKLNNDSIGALRSGTDNPNAIVVVLGAGTVAAGHNAAGKEIRLPALGWISGDWGGGGELASEAIRTAVRAHDGRGSRTALETIVLEAYAVADADALVHRLYLSGARGQEQDDRNRFYGLAPRVFEAADAGDAVAIELVDRQAGEVVVTAVALLRRLDLLDTPADVVLAGSLFKTKGTLLIDTIRSGLARSAPAAHVVLPNLEPAVGAYFCGLDELGIGVDAATRVRAADSYRRASSALVTG